MQILFGYLVLIASVTLVAYVLGAISNVIMDQDAALVRMRTQVRLVSSRKHGGAISNISAAMATCTWLSQTVS